MRHWSADARIPVTVLGATGLVGQTVVRHLLDHPWFTVRALAASDASAGKRYADVVRGGLEVPAPLGDQLVVKCTPEAADAPVVISALDAGSAREVEPRFAEAGALVMSNAGAFRMEADVPLVVPEVNADRIGLLAAQRRRRDWTGGIVCNPNCVVAIAGLALAPVHARFGIRAVSLTTLQAASGAGYPGVAAWDLLGNVIPHIDGEEAKICAELQKLLGESIRVGAQVHRVPVPNGHLLSLEIECAGPAAPEEVVEALREWRGPSLPSLPPIPIVVSDRADRPQPRLDLAAGRGMAITVGRVRAGGVLGLRMVVLGDNLVRGAAGAAIANAELAVSTYMRALIQPPSTAMDCPVM